MGRKEGEIKRCVYWQEGVGDMITIRKEDVRKGVYKE